MTTAHTATQATWVKQTVGFTLFASDGTDLGHAFAFAGRWPSSALNADGTRTHFPSALTRTAAKRLILAHHGL